MNEIFLLYVWTRLSAIQGTFFILALFCITLLVVFLYMAASDPDDWNSAHYKSAAKQHREIGKKYWRPCAIGVAVFSLLFVITPSKTDAAIIAGGWLVKEASQSEVAKNIGERTYKLIVGRLDEELAKLEGEKK